MWRGLSGQGVSRTALFVAMTASCGDGIAQDPDAEPPDGRTVDAAVDAPALDASPTDAAEPDAPDLGCGLPCGECAAGTTVCEGGAASCVYPSARVALIDPAMGLPPADVGTRMAFRPEEFTAWAGQPHEQIRRAGMAAAAVGGAVVLARVYDIETSVVLYSGVMYTGGGLRRACTPRPTLTQPLLATDTCIHVSSTAGHRSGGVAIIEHSSFGGVRGRKADLTIDSQARTMCAATAFGFAAPAGAYVARIFPMVTTTPIYSDDIVIDSMLFDGNAACNDLTHDWRENPTAFLPGSTTVRNSVFINTPAENMTICGGTIERNLGLNLGGSFVHKSCAAAEVGLDTLRDNYVENTNLNGNAVMVHSEGLVTFSANSRPIVSTGNVYRIGREGVWGNAGPDDADVTAAGDCYAHFPRLIRYVAGADPTSFHFADVELIDVGPAQ